MDTLDRRLKLAEDRIDPKAWTPPKQGIAPEFRLFGKWWNVAWLCLFAWVFLLIFSVGGTWFIERVKSLPCEHHAAFFARKERS